MEITVANKSPIEKPAFLYELSRLYSKGKKKSS